MSKPNRRFFLLSATGAAVGGCSSATEALRVFVYSGGHEATMREVFAPRFEALTGKKVALTAGWWEGIAKLKAAPAENPPFDLMITDATQGFPAARDGLFHPIDLSMVPHHRDLAAVTLDHWVFKEKVGIPYPDSVMTLAYRHDIAKRPTRWADLLAGEHTGQLGLYQHFYMSLYTFAAMLADSLGKAGQAHAMIESDLDEVMRFAREQAKRVKLWWKTSPDMILALAQGGARLGNMHSPEYIQAMRENNQLAAVVPEADRAFVQVFWAIPAGCPRLELAYRALNLLFSKEVQIAMAKRGSATSRLDAAQFVAEGDPLWASLYPHTSGQFGQLRYYPYDRYARDWDEITDVWQRTVLEQR